MRILSQHAVIVSAARTPVGKFLGALSPLSAVDLGAIVVREATHRAAIDPSTVDECIMGCVLAAGLGQNPARQAALRGGLTDAVSAFTINMVCGSGLQSVALAAQSIVSGNADVVVAGGMESMSNAPYLLPNVRRGLRMGDSIAVDSMIRDGLWCACEDFHMGMTAELVAERYAITREQQDRYALESHRRAASAQSEGRFDAEIVPVSVPGRGREAATIVTHDESIRHDGLEDPARALSALAALRPAFKPDGTVTAGNAPGVNDAAAAVVVMSAERARALGLTPLAAISACATSGVAPKWVLLAPITGVQKVLVRAEWPQDSVDLFELNEAFSVQAIALQRELGLDPARVNVNGGSVAIGHPIGASGARILVTLLYEMQRRNSHRGVAALCLGGGNSVAMALERPLYP